jgi:hypothetical protein
MAPGSTSHAARRSRCTQHTPGTAPPPASRQATVDERLPQPWHSRRLCCHIAAPTTAAGIILQRREEEKINGWHCQQPTENQCQKSRTSCWVELMRRGRRRQTARRERRNRWRGMGGRHGDGDQEAILWQSSSRAVGMATGRVRVG